MGASLLYTECVEIPQWTGNPGPPGGPKIKKNGSKSGFSLRKPAGDLAPTCPDHMVSLSPLKTDIQPSSLIIFIFFVKKGQTQT